MRDLIGWQAMGAGRMQCLDCGQITEDTLSAAMKHHERRWDDTRGWHVTDCGEYKGEHPNDEI